MSVTKRCGRRELRGVSSGTVGLREAAYLVERAPCVAIGNDTIKTDFVKVGRLQLQHLVDASTVDGVSRFTDLLVVTLATEASSNKLLAVLIKKIECGLVSTC